MRPKTHLAFSGVQTMVLRSSPPTRSNCHLEWTLRSIGVLPVCELSSVPPIILGSILGSPPRAATICCMSERLR